MLAIAITLRLSSSITFHILKQLDQLEPSFA